MARLVAAGVTFREQVDARWPDRDRRTDGWIADSNHAPDSDHQPDRDGWVHALDVDRDLDPADRDAMQRLADQLVAYVRNKRPGWERVKYVVWDDRIASGTYADTWWVWRGSGYGHTGHLHVSWTDAAERDGRPFPLPILMEVDDVLSDQDVERIADAVWDRVVSTGWQNDGTFDPDNRQQVRAITLLSDARGVARRVSYQQLPAIGDATGADPDAGVFADAVVDEIADRLSS